MNDFRENKLISDDIYPGQNVPEISPHWWAAAMKKMGRLLRLASVVAVSHVEYQMTDSDPTGSSTAPRFLGPGPFAWSCAEHRVIGRAIRERNWAVFWGILFFIKCINSMIELKLRERLSYESSSFSSVSGQLTPLLDVSRIWNWCPIVVG